MNAKTNHVMVTVIGLLGASALGACASAADLQPREAPEEPSATVDPGEAGTGGTSGRPLTADFDGDAGRFSAAGGRGSRPVEADSGATVHPECDAELVPVSEPTSLTEVPSPAALGIAAGPLGYAVLVAPRSNQLMASAYPAAVLFVDGVGALAGRKAISGFSGEPLVAYTSPDFTVFDATADDGASAHLWHVPFAAQEAQKLRSTSISAHAASRAITGEATAAPVVVSANGGTLSNSAGAGIPGALVWQGLTGASGSDPGRALVSGALPRHFYRPAVAAGPSGYAVAWLETKEELKADHTFALRLVTVDAQLRNPSASALVDTIAVKFDGTYYTLGRQEIVRPQVAAVGDDYLVGWFGSETGLSLARYTSRGGKVCEVHGVPGVLSWGWNNSLVTNGEGAYAAAVDSEHQPVILRIDEACHVTNAVKLSDDAIAFGASFQDEKPLFEVGHPVLARRPDGNVGAAWVAEVAEAGEDAGAPTPRYVVRSRIFGAKACQ